MSKRVTQKLIYAYGFDKAGFSIPTLEIEKDSYQIQLIDFNAQKPLEGADGIIIPSGIFEQTKFWLDRYGHRYGKVDWNPDHLAMRTKQLQHHIREGGWVCFLLGTIDNGNGDQEMKESDLAKVFLNNKFYSVVCHNAKGILQPKVNEFSAYFKKYGISRTTFWSPVNENGLKVLAADGHEISAAEFHGQLFFLPWPEVERSFQELEEILGTCVHAILEYKCRNDLYLPAWVEETKFKKETAISNRLREIESEFTSLQAELKNFQRNKGILTTSGHLLNTIAVDVLRNFFHLNVKSKENYVEDATICDSRDETEYVIEVKGVKGGLKREHVNQVDSHRERLGLGTEVSGLLIINDFMDIDGIEERKKKEFDPAQLKHAENLNIKILRTTTLFETMLKHEENPQRKQVFLKLCRNAKPLVIHDQK
ncbi:MAG TPA: hypothetical protein VGE41_09810 [Verrucomicrobiae bacterium]